MSMILPTIDTPWPTNVAAAGNAKWVRDQRCDTDSACHGGRSCYGILTSCLENLLPPCTSGRSRPVITRVTVVGVGTMGLEAGVFRKPV